MPSAAQSGYPYKKAQQSRRLPTKTVTYDRLARSGNGSLLTAVSAKHIIGTYHAISGDMNKANALVQEKKLVGNGQCVALIHAVTNIPATVAWHKGEQVKDNPHILPGTIIATFDSNGRYGNHTDGTSHVAIYLHQTVDGIVVVDQWNGRTKQPPHQRTIRFRSGIGLRVDDGSQYYVVQ